MSSGRKFKFIIVHSGLSTHESGFFFKIFGNKPLAQLPNNHPPNKP